MAKQVQQRIRIDELPKGSYFRILPSLPEMIVLGASPDLFQPDEVLIFAARPRTLHKCDVISGATLVIPTHKNY